MAWQCISSEVTVKSVMRCCISNAVDGTDNGMLWSDIKEDGNVRSVCKGDEGTDCEDGDSGTDW